mmetsp:Transcript_13511/g.40256  ORF Transcript_13511/g.40256 Transcript_13511/m.40256 type:complete len:461 (+) Transcript_13511:150-1532(+)
MALRQALNALSRRGLSSSAPTLIRAPATAANGIVSLGTSSLVERPTRVPCLSRRQASPEELVSWLEKDCGLRPEVAAEYSQILVQEGYDSPRAIAGAALSDLERKRVRPGHAVALREKAADLGPDDVAEDGAPRIPPPKLFDYDTIVSSLTVADAIETVEDAFCKLAEGKVDVPMPMHITIDETADAGPGDCHIKGGYVSGAATWTVKLASVSFYKNLERGLPPGGGVFVVMNAVTGQPCGIFQENRFMTDLRTGAAGGIALKHLGLAPDALGSTNTIGFVGCGAIARVMARAAKAVRPDFKGLCWAPDGSHETFAADMEAELGVPFEAIDTAAEMCKGSDVIYTQTPGGTTCLEKSWLKPHATIICSGSDQPTKQEIPTDVLSASKYVSDLTKQTSKVGELRSALADGTMKMEDVYAELGEICNGSKPGREGKELIVCDLTGTGAQDAAIGQVAWDKLG